MGRKLLYPIKLLIGFSDDIVAGVDAWIASQPEPRPSRSDAIRTLLADALRAKGLLR
jgi:hypothetical protein